MPYRRHHTREGRPYREAPARDMASNRNGYCCGCGQDFAAGDRILWEPSTGRAYAFGCDEGCAERRQHCIARAAEPCPLGPVRLS
jgi:hypothetical protein